jgi:hypothetical protein
MTRWNEWIAGRLGKPGGPPDFIDQFDQDFRRDIAARSQVGLRKTTSAASGRKWLRLPSVPSAVNSSWLIPRGALGLAEGGQRFRLTSSRPIIFSSAMTLWAFTPAAMSPRAVECAFATAPNNAMH